MAETIVPVVHGRRRDYRIALGLHVLAATGTAAIFGALGGLLGTAVGAPWGRIGLFAIAGAAGLYVLREAFGLPVPTFDRRRQVPDWWRTFYSPKVSATLYGAGLGVGFMTFLRHGTFVVVTLAAIFSGDPLTGAFLCAPFGLARGLTVLVTRKATSGEETSVTIARLERVGASRAPFLTNAAILGVVMVTALITTACDAPANTEGSRSAGYSSPAAKATSDLRHFTSSQRVGSIANDNVIESSGLVASRTQAGVLWTHNDSGGGPYIYCLRDNGSDCGRWKVADAGAVDWEDISIGPGPEAGVSYLYIADIGNNSHDRKSVVVYRVPEPDVESDQRVTKRASAIHIRYPRGVPDAEAMFVLDDGDIYVITKSFSGPPIVFVDRQGGKDRFERLVALHLPSSLGGITGADISPDGQHVALATYTVAYELTMPAGASSFDDIWSSTPVQFRPGPRGQGEAIAYDAKGDSLYVTSEGPSSPLLRVRARKD
ncbi:MAG: hypothetical protein QOG04_1962 [Actinomycetota bacterium]|jgi:hypothetical protein|nr:hypothetical protein [Actinomycetota bacterium]